MTAVHVHLTRPQRGTTTRLPAQGILNVSLFRRQVEGDQYVLVTKFAQVLSSMGETTLQLTPTAADQAWLVEERVPDGRTRAVAVPDSTQTVEYVSLLTLDLATLTPAVDVTAAWSAAAALAVQARDQAYAARDAAVAAAGPSGLSLQKATNLSDLTSASSARVNLGLGTAATQPAAAFDAAGSAAAARDASEPKGLSAATKTDIAAAYLPRPLGGTTGQVLTRQADGSAAWAAGASASGVALDTDGVPYYLPGGTTAIALDTDGVPYLAA